jgi:hypothetical protein
MVALPDSIIWDYLLERVRRYNQAPSDDLLYRIGTHVNILTPDDQRYIEQHGGILHPQQRYHVLNWLLCQGIEIKGDLALLIFGHAQLTQWLEKSRQSYPSFEFYLSFEYLTQFKSGYEDGICFTMHWMPKPGAPVPDFECDFSWKLCWEHGEMFWADYPDDAANQFDFCLGCYPNQQSFATPGSFCEEGDRYTTPSPEEADLMSVAQVLNTF